LLNFADLLRALDVLEVSARIGVKNRFAKFKRVNFAFIVFERREIPGLPNFNICPADDFIPNVTGEGPLESAATPDALDYLRETSKKFTIWAQCFDTSGDVAPDGSSDLTADTPQGQAGWDIGIKFSDLASACRQIETTILSRGDK